MSVVIVSRLSEYFLVSNSNEQDILLLVLSLEEAHELFQRCLRSHEDDTEASTSAMRKLGDLIARASRSEEQKAA